MPASLTDTTIRALPIPETGQKTYWDSLAGFGIRVSPGGTKTFVLVYGKERRRVTLGRYPIISLTQARAEAKRLLAEITLGKTQNPTIRFEDALNIFLTTHCKQKNKASTTKMRERLLRKHFAPLNRKTLDAISPHDISEIIDDLLDTPSEANHAFAAIRVFMNWARQRHYIPRSPCEGMPLPARTPPRDRVLTDAEIKAVWHGSDAYPFGTIARLLLSTGARRTEIGALRWAWIDTEAQTITWPPEITKNGRRHTLAYGPLTASILATIPRLSSFLFPSRDDADKSVSGWSQGKYAIDRRSQVRGWSLHDLRRTYATLHQQIGTPIHVIERLLNHAKGATTGGLIAVYQRHSYFEEMKAAQLAYEAHIAKLVEAA